ncbi:MAG: hypothetical protein WBN65_14740 [Gammaproteobacteria bacterium]
MPKKSPRAALAEIIASLLEDCREARQRITDQGGLKPAFAALARWQACRLSYTHADLLASPRYGPAASFVFTDLYGDRDYSPRDEDLERVYPMMVRMMPASALQSIILALEAHALTQSLDIAMVEQLERLGDAADISAGSYAEAYRACANEPLRRRQIDLVLETGQVLDRVVRHSLVYNMIRLAHGPAHMAGFGALHDFLERGFKAFRHMEDATEFLQTIHDREIGIMDSILAGAAPEDWAPAALT